MALNLPEIAGLNLPPATTEYLNDFKNLKDDGISKFGEDYFTKESVFTTNRSLDANSQPGEPSELAVYCRVQIRKAKEIIEIPFMNIENLDFIESQDNIMYYGVISIKDPRAIITDKYTLTGEETIIISFGRGAKGKTAFIAKIIKIEGLAKFANQDSAIMKIHFAHPMVDVYHNIVPMSFNNRIDETITEVMDTYSAKQLNKPIITKTANKGLYVNPNLSLGIFLNYLKDISISTKDEGAYSLFITRNRYYFVPKDYFNRKLPYKTIIDKAILSQDDIKNNVESAIQIVFNPFTRRYELDGINNRKGWAYNFAESRLINYNYNLNDEKVNKSFLASYLNVGRNLSTLKSKITYTGFRNENDLKGFIKNQSEIGLEKTAKAMVVIQGDVNWEPGEMVELNISHFDSEYDKNIYLSGKWIVNSVNHNLSYDVGYLCILELYRNSSQSAADQNLLLRVG